MLANLAEPLAGLPLTITSDFAGGATQGAVSGRLNFPYSTVRNALRTPTNWCAMLVLHLNVKACTYADETNRRALNLYVGKKEFQSVAQATLIQYEFGLVADSADSLEIRLNAARGPMGTRNYEIFLLVQPQGENHSFVSFRYRYELGTRAKFAMESYLNTAARAKVGFTVSRTASDGTEEYVSGIRGLTERNVVRYFLAIVAYLECASPGGAACDNLPEAASRWFDLTARYPKQLLELSRDDYLHNKQQELDQQTRLQAELVNSTRPARNTVSP